MLFADGSRETQADPDGRFVLSTRSCGLAKFALYVQRELRWSRFSPPRSSSRVALGRHAGGPWIRSYGPRSCTSVHSSSPKAAAWIWPTEAYERRSEYLNRDDVAHDRSALALKVRVLTTLSMVSK